MPKNKTVENKPAPTTKRGSSNMKRTRERGPSYPQKRPNGPWEARSYMPHKGEYLVTFHHDRAKAEKRLAGNRRHTLHQIVHHEPVEETVKEKDIKKDLKKALST